MVNVTEFISLKENFATSFQLQDVRVEPFITLILCTSICAMKKYCDAIKLLNEACSWGTLELSTLPINVLGVRAKISSLERLRGNIIVHFCN